MCVVPLILGLSRGTLSTDDPWSLDLPRSTHELPTEVEGRWSRVGRVGGAGRVE